MKNETKTDALIIVNDLIKAHKDNLPYLSGEVIEVWKSNTEISGNWAALTEIKDKYNNDSLRDIKIVSSVLNTLYSTHLTDSQINAFAQYLQTNFETVHKKIHDGETNIVMIINDNYSRDDSSPRNMVSFCSKYCCLYNPDKFPIYDLIVREFLNTHSYKVIENSYKSLLQQIIGFCREKELNLYINHYRELDKFMWLYQLAINSEKLN